MKFSKINTILCALPIIYFVYLWIEFPNGVSLKRLQYDDSYQIQTKSVFIFSFYILFSVLYFIGLIFKEKLQFHNTINTKRTQGELWAYGFQAFVSFVAMYLSVHHILDLTSNASMLIMASMYLISGNYNALTPYQDTNTYFTNKYEKANPIIWRKSFRLKGILQIGFGFLMLIIIF